METKTLKDLYWEILGWYQDLGSTLARNNIGPVLEFFAELIGKKLSEPFPLLELEKKKGKIAFEEAKQNPGRKRILYVDQELRPITGLLKTLRKAMNDIVKFKKNHLRKDDKDSRHICNQLYEHILRLKNVQVEEIICLRELFPNDFADVISNFHVAREELERYETPKRSKPRSKN